MDVFGGAPRFLAYPRPVVVQSGTDAVLKCQISGDPRPAVIWERNNEKIHPGGRYRLFEDGNIYNLIITVVTAEDSGQYICKAKNCIGETYAAATLKVEGEAQEMELREENKPRFLIKPLSTRVGRGDDAVFSCKLWGKPRPEVVWEKDGKKLNEIFESTHFSVGYQDGGWFQLKIFKTRAPDGGVYTCKARNEFGESLAGAVLLVDAGPGHEDEGNRNGYTNGHWKAHQGKQRSSRHVVTRLKEDPVLTSAKVKMFAVTEGKHAKFRCYVTGKPKPEIIWRKDGRIILSGRRYLLYEDREGYFTLKVLYCKQQDNGVYVCAASNTAGQTLSAVHLFVKEPPVRFKQPLNDLEVWERDLAILECEVPEDSVPITWYLEDRRLQPGAKYGMEEWGTKRRLTIRDMGVDDDGIYLCEMPDGGRSIAEVTVKGTIVRKLPRKVDVLEGENAAFCVEVEEEEMDIHWYKDGTELRETHQTIIKSFGRTHILVFVNTTPQDSGMVIFYVGRSKTSSQLRVKAVRQCPPSCPVGVQINTERANAALLSWVPAQDCRKNPPSGYILERQEIGSQEWLQCLTTDSATSVEILGDSVPCEADYRFRICSINKYGRSGYVEFPRAVHLVPVAKIQAPLQDALVPEGQDAYFSIELSASVIGTWFWNGNQVQEDERFLIRRSRTHQSLRIRGVRDTDNGAEITFIAYGIRDSAALYIQAPLVKFTPLSEMDRNKFVEVGNPIVLYCELSDPEAPVRWYKNGVELHSVEGLHIQSEGTMRRIVIQSAEFCHSGVYSCDAIDDVIRFNVEVEAPPVRFIALPDLDRNKSIEAGCPIVLQCELSDPSAQVFWYKDEAKLLPQTGLDFQSNGTKRALVVEKADFFHSGVYSCKTKGAAVQFNVEIKAPPVRFSAGPETERRKCIEAGSTIVLQCEISDSSGQVRWFKDGKQILTQSCVDFQSEGCIRRLIIESAALSHSGVYRCTTKDDIIEFQVEIKAVPVRFSTVPEVEKSKCIEAGSCFELRCEVSDPTADVHWYKDETEILTDTGWDIQAEGTLRMLVVQSAEPSHSGLYSCNMPDDSVQFTVDIKAPPVKFSAFPGVVKNQLFEADYPTEPHCEISDPPAKVCWYEDGVELLSKSQPHIKMEDTRRKLAVKAAQPSESGWHDSLRKDDVIQFNVQDEAPPLKRLDVPDVEKSKCTGESISTAQQCKLLDSTEYNYQLKDEGEILSQDGIEPEPQIKWEMPIRTLSNESSETPDNETNRPRTPDDHPPFNADKAEQSHSEVYKGETYDDTVQCTVDMKAESFPEIAKTNIIKESLGVTDGSEFAESKIIKESLGFLQGTAIPELAKNEVIKESLSFTDIPKLTKSKILKESLSFTAVPDLAETESTKESLSFTELLEFSKSKNLKESLSFTAVSGFSKTENTKESLSLTDGSNVSKSKNLKESLSFIADPDSAKTENTKESLSFTDGSNVSKSKDLKESLSFIADPDSAKTENIKESLSFTDGSNVSKSKGLKECLSFIADPDSAKTENTKESLSFTDGSDFAKREIIKDSLSLTTFSMLDNTEISKESLSFTNCPEFTKSNIIQESSSFTAVPELLMKENIEESSLKPVQHTKSDSTAPFRIYKDEELLQPQCVKQETACSFQEDDRSYFQVQEMCTDDDVLAFKVDREVTKMNISAPQGMSDEKAFEEGCLTDLGEISEKKAQIFGHGDVSIVQQQHGENMMSNLTSKEQFAQLSKIPHKEVLTTETKNQSVMYQDQVKAPSPKPVKFAPLPETGRTKTIESGMPLVLQCEISEPDAPVCWFKDGIQLQTKNGLVIQSEDRIRRLVVPTAELCHTGVYNCEAMDDVIKFKVYVKAAQLKGSTLTETEKNEMKSDEADNASAPQKEPLDSTAQVCWYRQEQQQQIQECLTVTQSEEIRSEEIKSAELSDSGVYSYKIKDTNMLSTVDPPAPTVMFSTVTEAQRNKSAVVGEPFELECEVSDAAAYVCWYKDGNELSSEAGVLVTSEGTIRKLSVQSAELCHSGTYNCKTDADAVTFNVDIKATPIRFSALPDVARNKFIEAGCPIILQCEISESAAQVSWFKDGVPLLQETGLDIKSEGTMRALIIQSAELKHSGTYSCEAGDDRIAFKVDVAASPVRFTAVPETEKTKSFEAGSPIILQCEISEPTALVQWYKDGTQLFPQSGVFFQSEHTMRTLVILSATFSHSGVYSCSTADDISEFYVDIKAPAVTFVYIPKEELHRNVVEQDKLFLCCEVSRSDAITQWYKDGVEIQTCNKVIIETENTMRKLIIPSVQMSDAGTYTCRAGGSALIFKVNVREPPVMIVYPKEDVHLDRHVPEEIVLSCELSRPNGKVTWFKDGQKLQESENMKLKTEGPYRRLKILHSRVEDSGEYVCDTADDSKFFHLSIKEPPVRIVSPSQSQMELCQQMSERMVLSCEISRANASVRWYRNGLEVEENNNLILEVDGIYRRLIIPETTVSDSAEYVCDTADDSVTFFVNIAEPPVRFIRPRKMAYEVEKFVGETIVLDCEVSRSNAEVSWKKNGEEIEENSNITITEDGCTRQLTIHSSRLEDTGQYLCDAKDDVMDFSLKINDSPLKFLHKSAIITDRHFVVSDAIVLKCELSRANGVVCWYKDNNRIVLNDHVTFEEEGAFRSLIILNAEIGDTGEYICNAKDDELVFNITVQEAPVSILRNPRTPEHYSLVAGNELILECEVSRENATVHWLCNGKVLQADARINIERRGTMRKLVLSNLQVSDSGEYICDAIDDKMNIMVTVQEPPFKFIKKEEINIDAYEEESVTLCAEVNRDNGSVQWSKGGKKISDHRFYATSDGPTHYLTINHLKKSDAGEYECDVGTDKAHFSIQVKAMKVKFSKPLQNIVGLKGSDAVLRCELHKSKGDVQWLKNNQEITPNRHFTIRADGQERSLTIHNITDDDEGEYTCESKDERTCATLVVKTPRVVEFIAELHNITVMEGEDATFKCVVSPEDAKMVWCRNGWPITSNERFKISSNGLCHMLYIRNCQVSDSCKLTAEAEGVISKAILQVQEKQVLFTKKMESVVAEEFGEATLEVELSLECGEVQWMRQGVVIHPGPKFAPKQCGQKRMLTIHKLALSDRGTYSCETLHDRTQAVLSVEPRKVKIRKGLREIQTFERETASFEVELTHSNVEGMWLKDGNRLKSNNHWRMTTKGRVHSLTIANLSLEDTGTYTFSTENARSSARLTVKEIPVSILKKLEDSTFPEGTGATLECELSKYNVTVKWTKNGEELKPGKNHRIYSMGRKCFLQILRCELGDSGVYVCDAGDATTSCSVEVYERDLEVLHSLEDLDIQEDQNAVFMCEVSLDDVPGEWFKNGEKIKPTSTIRIRQEGTKHFLLMCNVKEEDSGEIKFVAKNVESVAYLEVERLPVNIVKPLQDKTALENTRVLLDCTVSNPRCSIRWYKGRNVILPSERFEICSEGCYRKLVIQEVTLEDAGMYSVQVGENTSSARLTVEAQPILMVQELQDVEVSAPEEACFMCEVSVPVVKSPMWTLNGEVLRPGPKVLLERMETVHKLTLKHTSEDMNGVVVFDSGKAKSTANLRVKK
ncbi:obscurin-like protein 1 isoform X3 [Pangasianodon hypophthalmus]|uniref:obscurin-like protein 1 isoform X3 n=1 Tax=Pangasianodon hypophthalmus TaxID=310915 RepID=UPI0023074FA4|nr:obscurin-like protein 1 isoform X3 [Pangasianodon hypophthalmus]